MEWIVLVFLVEMAEPRCVTALRRGGAIRLGMAQRRKAGRSGSSVSRLTCVIEREDDGYVASCPEVDVASQGESVEEARANLIEAVELFFETASASEIRRRLAGEVYVTGIEVRVG
jgi:predicted RNase H-like HicB family nuclease